uniref:RxLR effector candidate protein n=1 Tax=Hyaloperonospora arabidopsidis (strain Emoy2) TaxID=559515 RepID=M4BBQ4_HYAAE
MLNTAGDLADYTGILVLRHGDTTRYLGYQVGTGDLVGANWALRIRNIRKRLATATTISSSVAVQILLLNSIMLPAVLFPSAVFRLPHWARSESHNLQKQFLWNYSTSTDRSRHKVNSGLLYTQEESGSSPLTLPYVHKT